jgi:hypothetical protein
MTEPREVAEDFELVAEGLFHWHIRNSGIGGNVSSSHALAHNEGGVLIDPVRLAENALARLPRPSAILLTARCHQRAAWRYRREFGAEVWMPHDAQGGDEAPDQLYSDGDVLPGGLLALRTPGPEWPHYSFLLEAGDRPGSLSGGVAFVSDLIMRPAGRELHFVPFEYHDDPAATRHSVEGLLALPFSILCLDHGAPITEHPKDALRRLLDSTE